MRIDTWTTGDMGYTAYTKAYTKLSFDKKNDIISK